MYSMIWQIWLSIRVPGIKAGIASTGPCGAGSHGSKCQDTVVHCVVVWWDFIRLWYCKTSWAARKLGTSKWPAKASVVGAIQKAISTQSPYIYMFMILYAHVMCVYVSFWLSIHVCLFHPISLWIDGQHETTYVITMLLPVSLHNWLMIGAPWLIGNSIISDYLLLVVHYIMMIHCQQFWNMISGAHGKTTICHHKAVLILCPNIKHQMKIIIDQWYIR